MIAKTQPLPMTVERIGVARNKNLGFAVIFHRGRVKLSTKYRVFNHLCGKEHFAELDPSEWRAKYQLVEEYKTSEPGRPS